MENTENQGAQPQQQQFSTTQPQYNQGSSQQTVNVIINQPPKSVWIAALLTFFFGPLGMFYTTVSGAIIMLIVSTILAIFTLGLSLFITQPICIIWAIVAANKHNEKVQKHTVIS